MAITQYVGYSIFFHDRDEYDFAIAVAGGNTIYKCPRDAATLFGIPFPYPSGDMDLIPKGIIGGGDYLVLHTAFLGDRILEETVDVKTFSAFEMTWDPSQPFALPGVQTIFQWYGAICYYAQQPEDDPTLVANIPQRHFIGGIEMSQSSEGGTFTGPVQGCRDASRTIDGFGYAIRAQNTPGSRWTRTPVEYFGAATRSAWDRFYFRLRRVGNVPCGFFRVTNSAAPSAGGGFRINTDGTIQLCTISAVTVVTVQQSTPPIDFDTWYRCDVLTNFPSTGAESGRLRLYLNGIATLDFTDSSGGNMDTVGFIQNSIVGIWGVGGDSADVAIEYDLDDWIQADIPNIVGVETLNSIDWLVGSHCSIRHFVTGSSTNWAGQTNAVDQGTSPTTALGDSLVSTTASAQINDTTDESDTQSAVMPQIVGSVAAVVGLQSTNAANTDGQLGYSVAGGAAVMATIDQLSVSGTCNSVLYHPSGLVLPVSLVPLILRHTKSADANSSTVNSLQTVVEEIGAWGNEDVDGAADFDRLSQLHNCRYPNTNWGWAGAVPFAPVFAVGGTYLGNATTQTVELPHLCHFLMIRGLTGAAQGVKWFGAGVNGHFGVTDRVVPNYPVRLYFDTVTDTVKILISGTNAEINAAGVTYQYIAFCDPGMRFNICGAYNFPAVSSPRSVALQASEFLPEAAFVQGEVINNASVNVALTYKGPGHAGNIATKMDGNNVVNWGTLSTGFLNALTDIMPSTASQSNYSAWRTQDGCLNPMVQITSYTGNGAGGTRVIPLVPATTNRFPLFALVVPHNSAAIFRDPSHAGTNSARFDTLANNAATGITAGGIDSITVGTTLNANGIIYDVFVIPGGFVSWANGTFSPPNCEPPETAWPVQPRVPLPTIAVMGNGGLTFDGTVPLTLLKDVSGIYTLVPGKTNDSLIDRQTGQASVDVKIPNPFAKTGFIGG